MESAARWLVDAFGFREVEEARMLGDGGQVEHAELEAEGALLVLGPPSVHGDSPRRGVSTMLTVRVPDVDAHYRRATAAGARVVIDLSDGR